MKRLALAFTFLLASFTPGFAAPGSVFSYSAASSFGLANQIIYCPTATGISTGTDLKCSPAQIAAYNYSLMSGDCTASGTGAITCTKTNGTAFSALATTVPGTGVVTALGNAVNASGGIVSPTPAAAGDIIYWNGTTWVKLAGNASGTNFLQETSAGVPSWAAGTSAGVSSFSTTCPPSGPSTGAVTFTNGANVLAESTAHTATTAECGSIYEVTGTTTITMPVIASGLEYTVINQNASGGATVTVAADVGHTIGNNAASSITLSPGQSVGIAAGSGATPTNWDLGPGLTANTPTGPGYNTTNVFLDPFVGSVAPSTVAPALLTAYCFPTWINNINPLGGGTGTLGTLSIDVTTLAAGGNLQVALYSNGSNNRPNALLGATANISTAATGWVTGTISVSVSQGQYWFCTQSDNVTVRWELNSTAVSMSDLGYASATNLTGNVSRNVSTTTGITAFGTWPSFAAASWTAGQNAPIIPFQFTSIP